MIGVLTILAKCKAKRFGLQDQSVYERYKGAEHSYLESSARLPDERRECSLKANVLIWSKSVQDK